MKGDLPGVVVLLLSPINDSVVELELERIVGMLLLDVLTFMLAFAAAAAWGTLDGSYFLKLTNDQNKEGKQAKTHKQKKK